MFAGSAGPNMLSFEETTLDSTFLGNLTQLPAYDRTVLPPISRPKSGVVRMDTLPPCFFAAFQRASCGKEHAQPGLG